MTKIILHLKKHGESLDVEIAKSVGLSIDETRRHLSELNAKGEIVTYHSTRFEDGKRIEGVRSRLVGYTWPAPYSTEKHRACREVDPLDAPRPDLPLAAPVGSSVVEHREQTP